MAPFLSSLYYPGHKSFSPYILSALLLIHFVPVELPQKKNVIEIPLMHQIWCKSAVKSVRFNTMNVQASLPV